MRENIIESLNIMWKGMLAILIVIAIIIAATIAVVRMERNFVEKKAQTLAAKEAAKKQSEETES